MRHHDWRGTRRATMLLSNASERKRYVPQGPSTLKLLSDRDIPFAGKKKRMLSVVWLTDVKYESCVLLKPTADCKQSVDNSGCSNPFCCLWFLGIAKPTDRTK